MYSSNIPESSRNLFFCVIYGKSLEVLKSKTSQLCSCSAFNFGFRNKRNEKSIHSRVSKVTEIHSKNRSYKARFSRLKLQFFLPYGWKLTYSKCSKKCRSLPLFLFGILWFFSRTKGEIFRLKMRITFLSLYNTYVHVSILHILPRSYYQRICPWV